MTCSRWRPSTARRKHHPARPAPATEANRPLTTVYEPGSTAKVITVGAALESGVVQPTTAFTVPWRMQIEDRLFKDAEEHNDEYWTVQDIVRESSNVGVIKIASLLGKERLDEYQRKFGFGTKTAIDFPYESAGLMKNVWEYVPDRHGLASRSATRPRSRRCRCSTCSPRSPTAA